MRFRFDVPFRIRFGVGTLLIFSRFILSTAVAKDDAWWGLTDPRLPQMAAPLTEFRIATGLDPSLVAWKVDFSKPFPSRECDRVWEDNRIPLIYWDAEIPLEREQMLGRKLRLDDLIRGGADTYVDSWARAAAEYRKPVLIQYLRSFNRDDYSWSLAANDRDPEKIRTAFRMVVERFRKAGAKNVRWVWGADAFPSQFAAWNEVHAAYPGDDVVDFIGWSGVDEGDSVRGGMPLAFHEIFDLPLRQSAEWAPGKSVILTSVGTNRSGTSKSSWLRDMVRYLLGPYDSVRGVIWQNQGQSSVRLFRSEDTSEFHVYPQRRISEDERNAFFEKPWIDLSGIPFFSQRQKMKRKAPSEIEVPHLETPPLSQLSHVIQTSPVILLDSPFIPVLGRVLTEPEHFSGRIKLAWNRSGLLVWSEIYDSSRGEGKLHPQDIWDGDCLEIDLGLVSIDGDSTSMKDSYRIQISPGGPSQVSPSSVIYRGRDGEALPQQADLKFQSQFAVDEESYRLFGFIPWKVLGWTPAMGDRLACDFAITDGVQGHRVRAMVWSGGAHAWHEPSEWGRMRLTNH